MTEMIRNPFPERANIYDVLRFAVAVPLVLVNNEWHFVFEVRNADLTRHPNEVSFPGGRIEPEDESSLVAALREMREELGIDTEDWEVLGALPFAYTQGARLVASYIVLRESLPDLNIDYSETEEVFTAPFDWFYYKKPHRVEMWDGVLPGPKFPFDKVRHYSPGWRRKLKYEVYFYEYGERVIWGLTARIIRNFLEICRQQGYERGFDFRNWCRD